MRRKHQQLADQHRFSCSVQQTLVLTSWSVNNTAVDGQTQRPRSAPHKTLSVDTAFYATAQVSHKSGIHLYNGHTWRCRCYLKKVARYENLSVVYLFYPLSIEPLCTYSQFAALNSKCCYRVLLWLTFHHRECFNPIALSPSPSPLPLDLGIHHPLSAFSPAQFVVAFLLFPFIFLSLLIP